MADLQLAHTADLDAATLRAARALLDDVFGAEMTDHDWEHALGGIHVLVWERRDLLGHGSVVQRRLLYEGRSLRTGYVEAVAIRSEHRRQGHGAAIMRALERVILGAYELGALGSSDEARHFYASLGWKQWRGPTFVLTPTGVVRTPDEDGAIHVLPAATPLNLNAELTCDWRDGDVW